MAEGLLFDFVSLLREANGDLPFVIDLLHLWVHECDDRLVRIVEFTLNEPNAVTCSSAYAHADALIESAALIGAVRVKVCCYIIQYVLKIAMRFRGPDTTLLRSERDSLWDTLMRPQYELERVAEQIRAFVPPLRNGYICKY
jgi:hypothetical protein